MSLKRCVTSLVLLSGAAVLAACDAGHIGEGTPAPAESTTTGAITGTLLLRSTMDSRGAVRTPAIGPGGTTNLANGDFTTGQVGNAARLTGTKVASWPAAYSGGQSVELDRGEVELWYRPTYASNAQDATSHVIFSVGVAGASPSLWLEETDRLSLNVRVANGTTYTTSAPVRAALWSANQWVLILAKWDRARSDSLSIYVDGTRVDGGGAPAGWTLGTEAGIGRFYAGAADGNGNRTASGLVDELKVSLPPASTPDAGVWPDAATPDSGIWPDAAPADSGVWPDATAADSGSTSSGAILLQTSLESAAAITAPAAGPAGTTNLLSTDFVTAVTGRGAQITAAGKLVSFPATDGTRQGIELDKGEISLWYRPAYDAASADDSQHAILVVGDGFAAPRLVLAESDSLYLELTGPDWRTTLAASAWHDPLWTAGQWVSIRAVWDLTKATDAIQIYVNGTRVDRGGATGGFSLGTEAAIGRIHVGTINDAGDNPATGVIDELIIRGAGSGNSTSDAGVWPDAAPADSGVWPDAAPADSGVWPDAAPADSGVWPDATTADSGSTTSSGALLQTSLESATAITAPAVGLAGITNLASTDFVTAVTGRGAQVAASGKQIHFPTTDGVRQNVELDKGEIEMWYRPSYGATDADDVQHALVVIGDGFAAPRLVLADADRLYLELVAPDWRTMSAGAAWHAPLWTANTWVHIRATWDTSLATDAIKIYVNGNRVDEGGASGGLSMGPEGAIGRVHVGSTNEAGENPAMGVIDELIVRGAGGAGGGGGTADAGTSADAGSTTADSGSGTADAGTAPAQDAGPIPTGSGPGALGDPNAVLSPGNLPLPAYGASVRDPVFGSTIRRITNRAASGGFGTHVYSQLQAFSSDNQYVLLAEDEIYVVRRTADLSMVAGLDTTGWNCPRWHPVLPGVIVHFDDNGDTVVRVQETDVRTLSTTTVFTLPAQYLQVRPNQSFDEISHDGRWLGGMMARNDGADVLVAIDIVNRAMGAAIPLPTLYTTACTPDPTYGYLEPDWAGASPLGRYLVVQWKRDGTERCNGLETFDIRTGAWVGRVHDGHQHSDLGVMPDGTTEFLMEWELYHPSGSASVGVRTLPGTASTSAVSYVLLMGWFGEHISCRGPDGACVLTMSGDGGAWSPLEQEVLMLYTNGNVDRLAHHRSTACGYWVQPRASISHDGRFVVFASDWGLQTGTNGCGTSQLGSGDAYVIDRAIPR